MKIDIWSDIACPWCYIGLTRFERALASFEHRDGVEVASQCGGDPETTNNQMELTALLVAIEKAARPAATRRVW